MTPMRVVGAVAVLLLAGLAVTVLRAPIGPKVTPPAAAPSAGRCPNQTAPPDAISVAEWQNSVLCLVNAQRSNHGLRPLQLDRRLARAGAHHATNMDRGDYFSHTEPNGSTVKQRAFKFNYLPGEGRWQVGEDLGWGRGGGATPRAIVQAWMDSTAHRREILTRSYRNGAVAAVRGAPASGASESGALTVAAEFGHR